MEDKIENKIMCDSSFVVATVTGLFKHNLRVRCNREFGHDGMCEYKVQWNK